MTQATIVALYGDKPEPLRSLLASLQADVADVLGRRFTPYRLEQIHATIVGLERNERQATRLVNRNHAILRGAEVAMDFDGLLGFLRTSGLIPFTVQIGGFAERDYPFASRGARPFERSFSLQGRSAVVMGWPVTARSYPPVLAQLRRGAERFGIVHAYHATTADTDNDFYFRLGVIGDPPPVGDGIAEDLARRLRQRLAAQPPLAATIGLSQLSVAFYAAPELSPATTRAFAVDDPAVTGAFIASRLRQG